MVAKVRVNITDASTGVVKADVEKVGVITDCVNNIIFSPDAKIPSDFYSPTLIEGLLGGLMIFNNNIDDTHLVPDVNERSTMIGNGNLSENTTSDEHKGSLVSSTVDADSTKFTWVFGETQGNGTIKSLCLTSNEGGEYGCNIASKLNNPVHNSFKDLDSFVYDVGGALTGYELNLLSGDKLTQFDASTGLNIPKYTGDLKNVYNLNIPFSYGSVAVKNLNAEADVVEVKDDDYFWYGNEFVHQSTGKNGYRIGFNWAFDTTTYQRVFIMKVYTYTGSSINIKYADITPLITDIYQSYRDKSIAAINPTSASDELVQNLADSIKNYKIQVIDDEFVFFAGYFSSNDTSKRFMNIYHGKLGGQHDRHTGELPELINTGIEYDYFTLDASTNPGFFECVLDANTNYEGVMYNVSVSADTIFRIANIGEDRYLIANNYFMHWQVNDEEQDVLNTNPHFYKVDAYKNVGAIISTKLADSPIFRRLDFTGSRNDIDEPMTHGIYAELCKYIMMTCYLATICNLDTPVTKTSSDVMYITYTLSQEDQNTQTEEDI